MKLGFTVRVDLPADLPLAQREVFSELALRVASRFSFLGMEDWSVDLDAGVKVLGVEREFHDLTARGRVSPFVQLYFGRRADAAAFARLLAAHVEGVSVGPVRAQAKRDWMKAWRKHYKTQWIREKGRAFAIVPAWQKVPSRGVSVRITPGQAFGTGTHPTTRLCLRLLLRSGFAGGAVLDFGAGTGVLAIAAEKWVRSLGEGFRGVAVESDREALEQCKKNARLNRVGALRFATRIPARGAYDLVFANVLSPVLLEFRKTLVGAMKPGGVLILSGILASEGDGFLRAFRRGLPVEFVERLDEGDWTAICLRKNGVHSKSGR